jgi:hypothetical protein
VPQLCIGAWAKKEPRGEKTMKLTKQYLWISALVLVCSTLTASQSYAVLINLGAGSFTPAASVITFSEVSLGTVNPIFNFTAVPGLGNVTVSFEGFFVGQAACSPCFPVTLADHTPAAGPLALDPAAPNTFTVNDAANATSPVLTGTPTFNGPISVLFSVPVAGVGLKGGFFDALNSTTIEAYDANGNILGSVTNSVTGFEFYGLADSTGGNVIQGISFFITGNEPAGFAIDNLTFGDAAALGPITTKAPESSPLILLGIGLLGLARFIRRMSE